MLTGAEVGPGSASVFVHGGVLSLAAAVTPAAHAALQALPGYGWRVLITGHGVAGAVAQLYAHDLAHQTELDPVPLAHVSSLQLVTFGAPAVGSPSFNAAWDTGYFGRNEGSAYARVVQCCSVGTLASSPCLESSDLDPIPQHWPAYAHSKPYTPIRFAHADEQTAGSSSECPSDLHALAERVSASRSEGYEVSLSRPWVQPQGLDDKTEDLLQCLPSSLYTTPEPAAGFEFGWGDEEDWWFAERTLPSEAQYDSLQADSSLSLSQHARFRMRLPRAPSEPALTVRFEAECPLGLVGVQLNPPQLLFSQEDFHVMRFIDMINPNTRPEDPLEYSCTVRMIATNPDDEEVTRLEWEVDVVKPGVCFNDDRDGTQNGNVLESVTNGKKHSTLSRRHEHVLSPADTPGGDAALTCSCPYGLPTRCDSGFCHMGAAFCQKLAPLSSRNNMDDNYQTCSSAGVGAETDCSSWQDHAEWLPPSVADNLQAACQATVRADQDPERHACVQQRVLAGLDAAFPAPYRAKLAQLVQEYEGALGGSLSSSRTRPSAESHAWLQQCLSGIYSGSRFSTPTCGLGTAFADTMLGLYESAYEQCCCAQTPVKYLAWLTSLPGAVDEGLLTYNQAMHGVCEDMRGLDKKNEVAAWFYYNVVGIWFAELYVIGSAPEGLSVHNNEHSVLARQEQARHWVPMQRSAAETLGAEGAQRTLLSAPLLDSIFGNNPSSPLAALLNDAVDDIAPDLLCVGNPAYNIWEKNVIFFSYTQKIPLYFGITLDLTAEAGAFFKLTASVELCPLALTASGSINPSIGADFAGSAAINLFLIKAGVTLRLELLRNDFKFQATLDMTQKPLAVKFDVPRVQHILTFSCEAFVTLRDKIKWCKVGFLLSNFSIFQR